MTVPVEMSHEKRLIKDLIRNYRDLGIMGRPVRDQNDSIVIKYGLSLIQIMDLDERDQILTTNVWATYVSEYAMKDDVFCYVNYYTKIM